ncbi:MAG: hypothetical protein KDA81_01925 [Planctomycetaceae bacterium]|nr:hypothetical protein [Planctomycetaceae bacterium]
MKFAGLSRLVLCAGLLLSTMGCPSAEDSRIQGFREKLQLSDPPGETTSVSKVRKILLEDSEVGEVADVVIRGRIDAGESPPWEPGKAVFVITDATGHEGEEDHDPHTCPFCSRNIKDYLARVTLVDESGKVIPVDTRELLNVHEKQLVIVKGKATLSDTEILLIESSAVYVPQR